jgi:hypothetical protein
MGTPVTHAKAVVDARKRSRRCRYAGAVGLIELSSSATTTAVHSLKKQPQSYSLAALPVFLETKVFYIDPFIKTVRDSVCACRT